MLAVDRRKSIIHIQNVFLTSPIPIYYSRETSQYVIGYEPKVYRVHYLTYKISKELVNNLDKNVNIQNAVDINIREEYRLSIRFPIEHKTPEMKTVMVRIIPTRYSTYEPIYGIIFQFKTRKTNAGGRDELDFSIPECPLIANYNTIPNICYKLIAIQRSNTGNHGINTYFILSKTCGSYRIGQWKKLSNFNNTRHRNMHIYPVTVML